MDYINRLDNYDGPELAQMCLEERYQLYEEALTIYKKLDMNIDAISVLINKLNDVERA